MHVFEDSQVLHLLGRYFCQQREVVRCELAVGVVADDYHLHFFHVVHLVHLNGAPVDDLKKARLLVTCVEPFCIEGLKDFAGEVMAFFKAVVVRAH